MALESWEYEKNCLAEAVARAEAKEREYRAVSEDVKRKLDALDLVADMHREVEPEMPVERTLPEASAPPMLTAASSEETRVVTSPVRRSWRPLFPSVHKFRA